MRRTVWSIPIANPAAGAGFAFTPAADQPSKLRTLLFQLATSATAANRQVVAELLDLEGTVVFQAAAAAVQTAGTTNTYQVSDAYGTPFTTGTLNGIGWPSMWLPPGWSVAVTVANEQAADQLSAGVYTAEFGWSAFERDEALAQLQQAAQALTTG